MPTKDELKILQALPLELKVRRTKQRIKEWVSYFGKECVSVSFSGGKDSTVMLHLVREMYGNDIPAVFVNTGLEYPEIQRFVREFENVTILQPKRTFKEIITDFGYPIISKEIAGCVYETRSIIARGKDPTNYQRYRKLNGTLIDPHTGELSPYNVPKYKPLVTDVDFWITDRCCHNMKKEPAHRYQHQTGRKPFVATMTEESQLREQAWKKTGCNAFNGKIQLSKPMSFWTEQDVLKFIKERGIKIAEPYGEIIQCDSDGFEYESNLCGNVPLKCSGCSRTGCIYCGFGAHLNKDQRFVNLKHTHPKHYDFCINGGAYDSKGIWKPNEEGLGMGHVFDRLNELYGENFIKYK